MAGSLYIHITRSIYAFLLTCLVTIQCHDVTRTVQVFNISLAHFVQVYAPAGHRPAYAEATGMHRSHDLLM
jgi:hypothetical protein